MMVVSIFGYINVYDSGNVYTITRRVYGLVFGFGMFASIGLGLDCMYNMLYIMLFVCEYL
jgi:hypothetical protein